MRLVFENLLAYTKEPTTYSCVRFVAALSAYYYYCVLSSWSCLGLVLTESEERRRPSLSKGFLVTASFFLLLIIRESSSFGLLT
jgi:hypothetical protein